MSKEKSTIGENIKKYRNKLGISQDTYIKRQILLSIRLLKLKQGNPNPTIETVKIADALGVSLDDLIK